MIPLWSFATFGKWMAVIVLGWLACVALVEIVEAADRAREKRRQQQRE